MAKHCIDYILYTPLRASPSVSCGIRAVAAAEIFEDSAVPAELFPSSFYPSDHISLVADLQIEERYP